MKSSWKEKQRQFLHQMYHGKAVHALHGWSYWDEWLPLDMTTESISYETGRKPLSSNCEHLKVRTKVGTYTGFDGGTYYENNAFVDPNLDPLKCLDYARSLAFPHPNIPSLAELEKKVSRTDEGPQLLNFLAELFSLKNMVLSLGKQLKAVRDFSVTARRGFRASDDLRYTLKGAGQQHLQTQFGILAPLSDVITALETFQNSSQRWQDLLSYEGVPQSYRWRRAKKSVTDGAVIEGFAQTTARLVRNYNAVTDVYIVASYELPPSDSALLTDLAFRVSSFGLDNLLSALWEGVPMSFVIDWFVPIGRLLASVEPDMFRVTDIQIRDMYIQRMSQGILTAVYEHTTPNRRYDVAGKLAFSGTFTAFLRERMPASVGVLPPIYSEFNNFDGLTPGQQGIGAALVAAQKL